MSNDNTQGIPGLSPQYEAAIRAAALDVARNHKGLQEPKIVHFVPLGDGVYLLTFEGLNEQRDWLVAV